MQPGHLALMNYGAHPLTWHTRILIAHIEADDWMIVTPDFDRYVETLNVHNPDLTDFEYLGATGNIPHRIPANSVHGLANLGPGEYAR